MNPILKRIYDKVPALDCDRKCGEGCTLIPVHPLEIEEIEKFTGRKVKIDDCVRGMSYKHYKIIKPRAGSFDCRYYRRGGCSIHEVRPLVCRLYGVCTGMVCLFGCKPERMLTDAEAHALIRELEQEALSDAAEDPPGKKRVHRHHSKRRPNRKR